MNWRNRNNAEILVNGIWTRIQRLRWRDTQRRRFLFDFMAEVAAWK